MYHFFDSAILSIADQEFAHKRAAPEEPSGAALLFQDPLPLPIPGRQSLCGATPLFQARSSLETLFPFVTLIDIETFPYATLSQEYGERSNSFLVDPSGPLSAGLRWLPTSTTVPLSHTLEKSERGSLFDFLKRSQTRSM